MKSLLKALHIKTSIAKTLLVVGIGISLSQTAAAQTLTLRSNMEGFHIGLNAGYKHWTSSYFDKLDELEPTGLGGGINLGYGINQHLELVGHFDWNTFKLQNEWDEYQFSAFGVGVRYNLGGTLQAIRPFAEVGYDFQNLLMSPIQLNGLFHEYHLKGGAVALSGGVNYFVTPNLSIQAKAGANLGKFSSFLVDGDGIEDRPDVKTFQFGLGVNYFFN